MSKPDLFAVIAEGSMRAAALIAADRGITPDPEALTRALRDQITDGWREAANDALEACQALSEAHGRHSLNLSCNLFALAALRQIDALPNARNTGQTPAHHQIKGEPTR